MTCTTFHSNPTNPRGRARPPQAQKPTTLWTRGQQQVFPPQEGAPRPGPAWLLFVLSVWGIIWLPGSNTPPPRPLPTQASTSLSQHLNSGASLTVPVRKAQASRPRGRARHWPMLAKGGGGGAVSPHRTHPPRPHSPASPADHLRAQVLTLGELGTSSSSPFPENWASCCS